MSDNVVKYNAESIPNRSRIDPESSPKNGWPKNVATSMAAPEAAAHAAQELAI